MKYEHIYDILGRVERDLKKIKEHVDLKDPRYLVGNTHEASWEEMIEANKLVIESGRGRDSGGDCGGDAFISRCYIKFGDTTHLSGEIHAKGRRILPEREILENMHLPDVMAYVFDSKAKDYEVWFKHAPSGAFHFVCATVTRKPDSPFYHVHDDFANDLVRSRFIETFCYD